jgi:branched-chain amino acid transport system ATP-binding protein
MTALLSIDKVGVCYGKAEAVRDVSLDVARGQIVTVIGANGAGKTSLLNTAIGLLPCSGRVLFDGRDVTRLDTESRVEMGFCLVPERRELFAGMSVEDNLRLGAYTRRDGAAAVKQSMTEVFARFPRLAERRAQKAGTLSGGERQMLALGRALMARPRVLLLDEPSLGLAPLLVQQIFRTLAELKAQGVTMLLVEQNINLALDLADRAYVLRTGEVSLAGSAAELKSNYESVAAAYLGARP